MKKLIVVLVAAFSIITFCLIYIIREGVSLRLGRVIEPTTLSLGEDAIARALVVRLTAVLQPSKYVVFGIDQEDPQAQMIMKKLESEFSSTFKISPTVVGDDADFIGKCKAPCWVISSPARSNHLENNEVVEKLNNSGEKFFTMSILRFTRDIEVPEACEKQKRISLECVTPLAVREARRKFKESSPYFFMRSYNEIDYFLFLEN